VIVGSWFAMIAGCDRPPPGVVKPSFSPSRAGSQAIDLFDKNKDGAIEGGELAASPGLQAAFPRIDVNSDGKLTAGEIADRVSSYAAQPIAAMPLLAKITWNGQPVANAKVTFVPEPFLKDVIKPATGTTDGSGAVSLTQEGLDFAALQLGMYRVEVSLAKDGGSESIPPQFNVETTLGAEVAPDVPNLERGLPIVLK
jgi:hypothetical protein